MNNFMELNIYIISALIIALIGLWIAIGGFKNKK